MDIREALMLAPLVFSMGFLLEPILEHWDRGGDYPW